MFTGIIRGIGRIAKVDQKLELTSFAVLTDKTLLSNLEMGASIAIDGVCLTVVDFNRDRVCFDAIQETLRRTTLKFLKEGQQVNFERSACFGTEIGGHILSGHIYGTADIHSIVHSTNNCFMTFQCQPEWTKYLFPKGYIALNGASLTLVDVDPVQGLFTVHFIPHTLQNTTFGSKKEGDVVNVEIDAQTQAIVETVEKVLNRIEH